MTIIDLRVGHTFSLTPTVKLTLVEIDGTDARIGVEAPKSVRVDRGEVAASKKQDRKSGNPGRRKGR